MSLKIFGCVKVLGIKDEFLVVSLDVFKLLQNVT